MKESHFFKQNNGNATTFAFSDFGAKLYEQRLYVAPLDVAACGPSKDEFEGALMLPLHGDMVPLTGTDVAHAVLKTALELSRPYSGDSMASELTCRELAMPRDGVRPMSTARRCECTLRVAVESK